MPLSDAKIRSAKPKEKAYKLLDAEGLYLEVRPTGRKYWRYRFNIKNSEGMFSIGEYPGVTLAKARSERDWAKGQARAGLNPNQVRKQMNAASDAEGESVFSVVANTFIAKSSESWNGYYLKQCRRILDDDILPQIGSMPIHEVKPADCLAIIESVEARGASTVAVRVRQLLSQIFRYGAARLLVESDPTFVLRGAIVTKPVRHHPALKREELPEFFKKLGEYGGYRPTVLAVRILAHTFVRTTELRKAAWSEFDKKTGLWSIPAERMKMKQKHVVPISRQVAEYLAELHDYTGGREFLFPNMRRPDDVITITTINRVLERMGYAGRFSGHGFRSTASTLLNEMGWRSDVIERQLSHVEAKGARKAYNHAEYLDERRDMMQAWSDYLDVF